MMARAAGKRCAKRGRCVSDTTTTRVNACHRFRIQSNKTSRVRLRPLAQFRYAASPAEMGAVSNSLLEQIDE